MSENEPILTSHQDQPEVQFFVPTITEVFVYLILGSAILVTINSRAIWRYFSDNVLSLNSANVKLINSNSPTLEHITSFLTKSRLPLILFWAVVGLLVYLVIWFFHNIIQNLRNDFIVDSYVHPAGFNRGSFWEHALFRKLLFGFSVVVAIAYLILIWMLMAALGKECVALVVNYHPLHSLLYLALSGLASAVLIYIFVLLFRTVGRCWRFITSDF